MDWLTFKFCVLIWVLCVSKSQSELLNSTSSLSDQLRSACVDGRPVVPPDECNTCICFAGQKYCTKIPCPEQDCVNGVELLQPDVCNKCICRRGKVTCSNMICIPAPHCAEKQLYPAQNKCNACMCMNGFITCTSNPCAAEPLPFTIATTTIKKPTKMKKCIEGEPLPGPGLECVECFCENGRKRCKNVCPTMESRLSEVESLPISSTIPTTTTKKPTKMKKCIEGESLPGPGLECVECFCENGRKRCKNVCPTMESRFSEVESLPISSTIPTTTTKKPTKMKKCIEGESLPGPGLECVECFCENGRKRCKNVCPTMESRFSEVESLPISSTIPTTTTKNPTKMKKCIEGESLPGPGLACVECFCENGRKRCKNVCPTMESRFSEVESLPISSTIPTTTTKKPTKMKKCIEGEPLPGPGLECVECFCENGRKRCKNVCPTMESRFSEVESLPILQPECVPGQHLPRPDHCNNCICFEGQIHCTHLPCRMDTRIGPECSDNQPVYRPDECNECYCFEGRLECSDLVCIRGSKCVHGQAIPKPDSCNACICVEGHILCTDYQCPMLNSRNALRPGRSSTEVRSRDECQKGDIISPPPPPNDCNTCYCMDNRILCTMNSCEGSYPEIKGRLKEPKEQTDLEIFDKQISVEPFINMLSKNQEKLPTKLIHTHAYNGFHQEIKVHASHLPKDATKLLKVLATSLDNSALASISQNLLTSSHSLSNNHDSEIPLDNQVVPTRILGEENVLTTQSNKVITSGSQSNETILVIPNAEPFEDQNSQSVSPLTTKHETIWKSVVSPTALVFNNNQQINPQSSQEEKPNVYNYGNPPSKFTSIDQNNLIRNPSKFGPPGLPHRLPTKPMRNIVEIPNKNTQSIYPVSNPKSININDGKVTYAPFSQEKKKITPSGFIYKRDELPDSRPYHLIKPGHNQVFNYTSSTPIFRPGKFIITPNNNGGQQKPQFIPNLSNYYPNHVKPQQIQFKPKQNHLPTLNNKGIQHPPLFPNNPNSPIVAANQYKQPQFGLKPGQGNMSPLNNKGNQTDQQFKAFHPNSHINRPLIHIPHQKKRIFSLSNEGRKAIPPHSMVPNSTAHHTKLLNPSQIGVDPELTQHKSPHSQFVPNPSIYYRNEYEAPKIIDVNPDQEQLIPHSKISYTHAEHNPHHTSSEPGVDTLIPKVRNKTKKYNTTHSHYEKHTSITYISEYDPTHSANPLQIVHDPNQYQNVSQNKVNEHYLPDQESQELDLTMSKVNYYLNLSALQLDQNEPHPKLTHYYLAQTSFFPDQQLNYTPKVSPIVSETNEYNQQDSWNITNHQFDTHPHSPSDGKYTDPHSSSQSQLILSQDNSKKGSLNDPKSAEDPQSLSNSVEDPTHPKSNKNLPPSQTGSSQNEHPPGVFDDRGSSNGFQYAHNAYEDPRPLKPFHKLIPSKLESPQNHQLPGFLDERGSADGFQYLSNSAEDLAHPKVKLDKSPHFDPYTSIVNPGQPKDNLHISSNSLFGPAQKQHKPGVFENREVKDGFQYAHNADKNPTHLKPLHKLLPFPHSHTAFDPTLIQHSPGMFDERASADGYQYPYNSAENPINSRGNLHNPKLTQFGSTQNQHLSGIFDERGSADGFHYPTNSAENPLHSKDKLHKLLYIPFGPTQKQQSPGLFDERGSADGFKYISSSAENPAHAKENTYKPSNSPFGPTIYKQLPGMFDERGSADGFQYPSNSAESPLHPKENKHKSPNAPFGPTTYKLLPGMYPSNSAGNPKNLTHPEQNKQKQSQSEVGPNHNKPTPGMFAGRGSPDNFQYSSNSVKNHLNPKDYLHYQFSPSQNQHLPGMFDNRGPPGENTGIKNPLNSVGNPTQLKDNLHNPPQSQFLPSHNQYTSGVFDDRGSADGFQYPSNSAENPMYPKQNKQIQPNSQFDPAQNQHLPGMFDDRGSADGFQYPSNSAENPTHLKQNKQIQPNSPFDPAQNQYLPGMFDERGSPGGFQYPSNSVENPTHPKQNKQIQSNSQFDPAENQHLPGMFDERGSPGGFQYPSNSVENPTHPKQNKQIQSNSQFDPAQNQHLPGMFDERGSADGFQYPSNSVENPTYPKDNLHKLQSQFLPSPNQHTPGKTDDRGSADGFQYLSNSAENQMYPKKKKQIQPNSQFDPAQNQHLPGMFDDRGSADGFQYPSNSAENPTHPKQNKQIQPNSQFDPAQNQHLPGMFDERGSADGFQYPSNSVENPTHPKDNLHKLPQSLFLPSPNQHTPGVFGDRGSADGFHYPSNSVDGKPPHSPLGPTQNQHLPGMFDERGSGDGFQYPSHSTENPLQPNDNQHNPLHPQLGPNQHTPGVFDDRGSADVFHYPSNSTENPTHPKNNSYTTPDSKFKEPQNQPKPSSLDNSYTNNNPLRPWMHLDHDQYKPSSFDNLLNGVHQIPWSVPNQDNNALGSKEEITTTRFGLKPKQDQYEPSMVNNASKSNQNENTDLTDADDNRLQIEQDLSTPSTEFTDSDNTRYNLLPKLNPDSDPDSLLLTDSGKIPDYYDHYYDPLFKVVDKLGDPPIDDSIFSAGSMDQLDLLPFLFPGIAKILNYEPSQDKDVSPDENHEVQRINPLNKLKSKLNQLLGNDNGILNWLKSNLNKLLPGKDNAIDIKNYIDMTKIFNLLSKLMPPKLKHTTALQNIPFSGFAPEIIENIMNDFKEDTLTTTSTPRTDSTHSYGNRFNSVPTIPEESQPQTPQLKYPNVHIILHQPNDEDDLDLPPYEETNGELNPATDIDSKELSASMFPKMFNSRFRNRPKDQKEECGDGTQWISNCHGCSCYFGQAMCFKLPDCKLRPLGEPMTCKPYSHFKMGCYTCECNGDGVSECDATDCNLKPSRKSRVSDSTESSLPIFNEFFDSKKTNEIMQYYNLYKKLPKDCPKQDLQTHYPTCEQGTSWVSSCHKCECNESGKHECIKIDDCVLDVDSYGKPGQCKPNSKFYPKMNSMPCVECSCNDEGISYCPTIDYKKH